jgi:hypothetical protein
MLKKGIKMKYIILFLLILFSAIVAADAYYLKTNNQGTIYFTCRNSTNFKCNNLTTLCNISINDPEGNRVVINQPTTFNVDLYQYNYTPAKVGDYSIFTYCYSATDAGYNDFKIQSNNQGKEIKNFGAVLTVVGLLALILIGLVIYSAINSSVWLYPSLIASGFMVLLFLYVWWSYSIILSDLLFIAYKIWTWILYAVVLVSVFELLKNYWDWLSRRQKGRIEYKDDY